MSPGHDRARPDAEGFKTGIPDSSSLPERIEQQDTPNGSAGTDAAAVGDTSTASPGVRAEAGVERRTGAVDRGGEAEKLAKQRELFGKSFSKPKR